MTFRITQPGSYRNRRGEKVEIFRNCNFPRYSEYPWGSKERGYLDTDSDIVGVWEKPTMANDNLWLPALDIEEPEVQSPKTSEYNLELVSERFRALEDGRSIKNQYGETVAPGDLNDEWVCGRVAINDGPWSLVPLKRKVTTRLYVYQDSAIPKTVVRREPNQWSDSDYDGWACLGAIEGSEQIEEVDQ